MIHFPRSPFQASIPRAVAWLATRTYGSSIERKAFRGFAFEKPGDPLECVTLRSFAPLPKPGHGQVQVKMLMAPINPSDVNVLQGVYPVRPRPRTDLGTENALYFPGNEGLGKVVEVGTGVHDLRAGDRVVMATPQSGTWSNSLNIGTDGLILTGSQITDIQAATMSINPPTALMMLRDFVRLSEGDFVIQNGSNSAVGQAVIQIAKGLGLKTINLVRNRADFDSLEQYLTGLGGDYVLTYDELNDRSLKDRVHEWTRGKPIRLALNCVSGKDTTSMIRLVGDDGHLVSYGAMSKQPLSLPTSLFIFKNLTAHGFLLGSWIQRHSIDERRNVMREIIGMLERGQLREPSHEILPLRGSDDEITQTLRDALSKLEGGSYGKKIILQFVD